MGLEFNNTFGIAFKKMVTLSIFYRNQDMTSRSQEGNKELKQVKLIDLRS